MSRFRAIKHLQYQIPVVAKNKIKKKRQKVYFIMLDVNTTVAAAIFVITRYKKYFILCDRLHFVVSLTLDLAILR